MQCVLRLAQDKLANGVDACTAARIKIKQKPRRMAGVTENIFTTYLFGVGAGTAGVVFVAGRC